MALTVEGGVLNVVVAARDGEILVAEVDVAFQIDIARVAVAPVTVVVVNYVVGIACQLCGIAYVDALLLAAGAQLIVLERLPVPLAVSVSGHVGTVLSEVFVFAPGPHISLIGKRCCDANHCHQQYQEPLFCKVFLHISCMLLYRFSLSR